MKVENGEMRLNNKNKEYDFCCCYYRRSYVKELYFDISIKESNRKKKVFIYLFE